MVMREDGFGFKEFEPPAVPYTKQQTENISPTSGENAAMPAPTEPVTGKIQDDPVFKSLPREWQVKVEQGMPLAEAFQKFSNQGQPSPTPAPVPLAGQVAANVQQQNAGQTQPVQSNMPGGQSGTNPRLGEGQLPDPMVGETTFARPGTRQFQGMQGKVFAPDLRQATPLAYQVRDQLRLGDTSRLPITGMAGGLPLEPSRRPRSEEDLIRAATQGF